MPYSLTIQSVLDLINDTTSEYGVENIDSPEFWKLGEFGSPIVTPNKIWYNVPQRYNMGGYGTILKYIV